MGTGVNVATDGKGSNGGGILPHKTSEASSGAQGGLSSRSTWYWTSSHVRHYPSSPNQVTELIG